MLQAFVDMFSDDREFDSRTTRFLSLVFLAVAGVTSFAHYTRAHYVLGFKLSDYEMSFPPTLLSAVIGMALVAPLYLRGILRWSISPYGILSFVLLLLVFSAFVELTLGGGVKHESLAYPLLGTAVILSWLGIRQAAGISWAIAASAAVANLSANNYTAGFAGFVFVVSGCVGLLLHTGLNPGQLFRGIQAEYLPSRLEATRSYADMGSIADTTVSPSLSSAMGTDMENT